MKILFILLASPCLASGPKYVGSNTDAQVYQEFGNVYHDISNPTINAGTASTMTIKNVPYATTLTAPAAYGQVGVLQSTSCVNSITTATNSATFVTTNLSCTITPKFASSRIAIFTNGVSVVGNVGNYVLGTIVRNDATNLAGAGVWIAQAGNSISASMMPINWVDSPATTSATKYSVYIENSGGASVTYGNGQPSTMILQEIQ